ncbi:hypothetical protein [Persicobacter psychrovividus]|uniref:Uncharacterized protein n=1 Tax=Persicobacter psychrovividus TaxID=387638 RepID=A0ABM7VMY2_9BACT|nr:hypothetical protein PEPS_46560 [Persicobacter psychrovividus]
MNEKITLATAIVGLLTALSAAIPIYQNNYIKTDNASIVIKDELEKAVDKTPKGNYIIKTVPVGTIYIYIKF